MRAASHPLLALGLLVGCGGATPPPAAPAAPAPPPDEAPSPTAIGTARECPSLADTRWWFVTELPSSGPREFEVVLHRDGSATIGDPADTTPDDDGWTQRGCLVVVSMNERFVDYSGELDGDRVAGRGLNVRGEKWDFVMTRR